MNRLLKKLAYSKSLILHVFIACLLGFTTSALAEQKIDESKQSLSELKKQIKSLKKALNNAQSKHKDATDALKESEVAISDTNKKLYEITEQEKKSQQKLAQLNAETEETTLQLSKQQSLLGKQFYAQYTQGKQSAIQLMLQQNQQNTITRDIQYYTYIAKARADAIVKMQDNLALLQQLNVDAEETLQKVSALKQAKMKEHKALSKQKNNKSKVVASLSTKIKAHESKITKLKRDEKSLASLVKKLAKLARAKEKAKKLALAKTKKSPKSPKGDKVVAENKFEPSSALSGKAFAKLKGKLRLPVKGRVLNRFGQNRKDTGISWKGLFIKAAEGANVKTVANGVIVFADWMRGFGNLIIVDHGGGYMSLYGNNQAILKSEGNKVKAGETIASVGNTGGNKTNGLYYELRKKTKPFDPLKWSKLN